MPQQLRISAGSVVALATLDDSPTARAILAALPLEAKAATWGDEIYFAIPVSLEAEGARAVVELGDLGYGRVEGDPSVFRKVRAGTTVRLARADGGPGTR